MTEPGPMIAVEHLVFDYPGLRALDDVSFAVEPQTITALVGPNGAGKTTLLRCIAALERPQSGRVAVAGTDVHEEPRDSHRQMGFLADFYGLYDDLTVAQCLRHRAGAQGIAAAERGPFIEHAARHLAIADRMDQRAGTLSRGLRQRLAIAQAIIHEPTVVLLDEPAAGLDPEARHELAAVLRQLRDQGMTLIVSSHILAELEDYSTDMLILDRGRVVEQRPILAVPTADTIERVTVALVGPDDRLGPLLVAQAGVSAVAVEGAAAQFTMAADPQQRHVVLKALVEAGLPVAAFGAGRASLQDAYLARMKDKDAT